MAERFFNNAGPTEPADHYCIDPLRRIRVHEVEGLIAARRYFVPHAPRQTGKTTCLLALMRHLNQQGLYRCAYANVEDAQAARGDYERGIRIVAEKIASGARWMSGDTWPDDHLHRILDDTSAGSALNELLSYWSQADPRPLVLMLDEIDSLVGDTLISVLRQVRAGYPQRPQAFPQSIIVCGVRDVRDYRIVSSGNDVITGGSVYNVQARSLRLGDFTEDEVRELPLQHTAETGQRWTEEALAEMWRLTLGRPCLVNALANEITSEMPEGRERGRAIGLDSVTEGRERLILRRDVHIDQLADKLKEDRVRRVIQPILSSADPGEWASEEDVQYVMDLGLVRRGPNGPEIANPIYREVLPRFLTSVAQDYIAAIVPTAPFVRSDGRLDLGKLLEAFQQFFRENSEAWVKRFEYHEAGPQLLLQAFLQRIVNGGGRVDREYGLGRMRTDLMVAWKHPGGEQRAVIEAKVVRRSREASIAVGLRQTREYMDRCGTSDAHLILFDTRPNVTWEERIFREEREGVVIWGM
ncbi:MAG: ATP-binding protein [Armatimonadetes bacterium]|nr:ATP-binding protein [Armatimonadota bacterium]